jgi:hypothetical protein
MIKTSNLTAIKGTHVRSEMLKHLEAIIKPAELSSA